MATTENDRAKSGKFKSRYDRNALFPLVADVCRFVDPDEPESVSQPDFDKSRAVAGHPHAPSGRAIYGRLKIPWEEIKQIALDPTRDVNQTLAMKGREEARKLNTEEIHFALNRIARELGVRTVSFFDYVRTREKLIAKDERRNGEGGILATLLPTAHQIENQSGTWQDALAASGLEPYVQGGSSKKGLSIAEAYDLVIELTGRAPRRASFDQLRSRFGISIAKTPPAADWPEVEREIREQRAARGLETPESTLITKAEWDALEIPEERLELLPRKRDKGHWTYERCLLGLVEFLETPGVEHSWRSYMKICPDHDWPPASAITRHTTWGPMIAAARHLRETGEILPLDQIKKAAAAGGV
jgi:hypothetical protein